MIDENSSKRILKFCLELFYFAKEIAYKNYQQNVDSDNLLLALIKDDDITTKILKKIM